MADAGSTGLQGTAELVKKLQQLGSLEQGNALRRAVRAGLQPTLRVARDRIPKGKIPHTSYLGNKLQPGYASKHLKIATTLSADKSQAVGLLSTNKEAFYAPTFVELGTSKMKAQPWLRPAFYATANEQRQALNDSLAATIDKIAKGTP